MFGEFRIICIHLCILYLTLTVAFVAVNAKLVTGMAIGKAFADAADID